MGVLFNDYEHVFSPIRVGHTVLKNRIEFSPMVCDLTNANGEATQNYIDFVEMQARTGVALITLGATPVDMTTAPDYPSELDVTSEYKLNHLFLLAEAAHRGGAKLSAELVHAGRNADAGLLGLPHVLAPSDIPIPGKCQNIKIMDEDDIAYVVHSYADCALRLKKVGFDAVMIHGAHGNLLAQFMSPLSNTREDRYGGSFENRIRFPLMVIDAVRESVGDEFLIEYRISGDEIAPGGVGVDDVIRFLSIAQDKIDLVNVSAGVNYDTRAQFYRMPPYYHPRGANIPFARAIKAHPDIRVPVSVVGGIVTAEMADDIIAEGSADMCAMARPLLADPELLHNAWRGQAEKTRPCLRCYSCAGGYGSHVSCAVNPEIGRTYTSRLNLTPSVKKKAIVVGGGVAGCYAAKILAGHGHETILFEKSDRLGGLLHSIDNFDFKDDLKRFTGWLMADTEKCGAEIRLGAAATPESVMEENPDLIVLAIGSEPILPPVPGIDEAGVIPVLDIDSGLSSVSGAVIVCGGGLSGCEAALQLAINGCDVTVIDMIPADDFASGVHPLTRRMLMYLLETKGVKLIGDRRISSIRDTGVDTIDADGRAEFYKAEHIVTAFGMKANAAAAEDFIRLIPDVYVIGDASEAGNIKHAVRSAYDVCYML